MLAMEQSLPLCRSESVVDLRALAQWPDSMPAVKPFMHGWFFAEPVLERFCDGETRLIVELGSWLGKSARWLCNRCPSATVVCVDHWLGCPELEHQWGWIIGTSYETFCRNLWEYRDQIVPLRMKSVPGLELLAEHGAEPDLIYIDAAHDFESVKADVETCVRLFPNAQLVGDDWNWKGVERGVLAAMDRPVQNDGRIWWTE